MRIQQYLHIGVSIDPLHPKISTYILQTVFYTFPSGADKEILLNNQELLCLLIIFIILMTSMFDSVVGYYEEKLDASHSWGLKG